MLAREAPTFFTRENSGIFYYGEIREKSFRESRDLRAPKEI